MHAQPYVQVCLTNESVEVRTYICAGLISLITKNQMISKGGVDPEVLHDASALAGVSPMEASATIRVVANYAKNFLPILFNLCTITPSDKRGILRGMCARTHGNTHMHVRECAYMHTRIHYVPGILLETISAYSQITDTKQLNTFLHNIVRKLLDAPKDVSGASLAVEEQRVLLDLALALAFNLDTQNADLLLKVAVPLFQVCGSATTTSARVGPQQSGGQLEMRASPVGDWVGIAG